jgi:hypothetical protein
MKRVYNIVFIEYKPLFTYLNTLFKVLISVKDVLIYLTLKRKVKESFKRSKKYLQL